MLENLPLPLAARPYLRNSSIWHSNFESDDDMQGLIIAGRRPGRRRTLTVRQRYVTAWRRGRHDTASELAASDQIGRARRGGKWPTPTFRS
jgi:hypothetical protein